MTPSIRSDSAASELPSSVPSSVTGPVVDRVARTAHQAVDRVAGSATHAVERMRSGLTGARSTVDDKMQEFSSTRSQWMDTCRETVREHPLAAIGIGLAAGWLVARVLSSSSDD